ncbi:uncharacterized protein LOC135482280 [Liolophura sinensis]|uniref:uncharacterized protein LOC135482280 n=1 Tax=Liolophura sinensis TaxID=3198878 RepID=UPI0031591ACD
MLWFLFLTVNRSQATIYCGKSIPNSTHITPTLVTQSSNTTPERTIPSNVTSQTTMTSITEPSENATTVNDTSSMTNSTTWPPVTTENQTEMSPTPSPMSSTAVTANSTSNSSAVNDPTFNTDSSSQVEVIVGSVIGAFFAVVIAVVLVIVLYRRHKSRKYTKSHHPLSNGANTARYENTSADLPLVAMGPSPHTTGYDHIAAVGTVQGDDNSGMYNNTGNVYNHTLDEEEYDHIQTVATVHPSRAIHRKQPDDTYNNLYEGHNSTVQLNGLSESTTDMNDHNSAANDIYSQIQDKPQSEQPGSDTILHKSHEETKEEFVENDLYQSVDECETDQSPTQHARGGQGLHSYHVLEKDFGSRVPENPPHSADKDVYKDETPSSTPHKSHDLTNEETEFVENDLYQSVDQCDTDKSITQHARGRMGLRSYHVLEKDFGSRVPENPPHSADKDVYKDETPSSTPHKSHDLTNEETEFVENDLYQSVDQCDTDKSITQHARGRMGLRSYHVLEKDFGSRVPENPPHSADKDVYKDETPSSTPHKSHDLTNEETEFVENDLYQSVDQRDTDKSPTQHAQGGQGLRSYHVLEKDFGSRVPENPPHSADKDVYKDETPSSTPHKSHDLTNEETEFVENDLYQSVDQCDTDKSITQHARGRMGLRSYHVLEKDFGSRVPENPPHSADKDVYKDETPSSTPHKSHDLTNEETEFVENDLYQSVDQCDTDKSITQHARGRLGLRSYHALEKDFGSRVPENPPHSADKDVYKDETPSSTPHKSHDLTNEETEFVENDLYQSVDQCDTDKSITQHARGRLRLRSYHVLEKDFGSRVPENPPHSADKDVYKDETPSSTPHKSHDLTNEETEFVENDLYQSADQL